MMPIVGGPGPEGGRGAEDSCGGVAGEVVEEAPLLHDFRTKPAWKSSALPA